mmetsp:Transcript_15312/g.21325  ORF Transcript_15312/g.21325 Transcript_15312/m.21325 type:complete len:108 (+) Transcript_15312:278-601(+)
MPAGIQRLSGLQKEVLSLYRIILREAVKKDRGAGEEMGSTSLLRLLQAEDDDNSASTTVSYARSEFRKQAASVRRSDFKTIEYSLRKGHKQLKLLQMPGVKVVKGAS